MIYLAWILNTHGMDENVWTFYVYTFTVLLHCNAHRKRCPKIPHLFLAMYRSAYRRKGWATFGNSLHPYPRKKDPQFVLLTIVSWLEFGDLDGDNKWQTEWQIRAVWGLMCSLFLLITRPRNFEWRNSIGALVKCGAGAHQFVEITQYWYRDCWYTGESIGFTNIRRPYKRVTFLLGGGGAKFRGRVSSSNSEHVCLPPYSPDLSCLGLRLWSMTPTKSTKLNQAQLMNWSKLWNVSLKIFMQRVSEKLPVKRVGARSAAWHKTIGNLWVLTAMCTAMQQKWKMVKTKCPNIFIHTICVLYQCAVYIFHKSALFLYHSFWITL